MWRCLTWDGFELKRVSDGKFAKAHSDSDLSGFVPEMDHVRHRNTIRRYDMNSITLPVKSFFDVESFIDVVVVTIHIFILFTNIKINSKLN